MFLLDLFAGIGGFHLAAEMAGMEFKETFFSEINEHAIKIYKKNFPASVALGDVTRINGRDLPKGKWILTGGFPCQPFSIAGNQLGSADSRYLWGEIVRLVSELKPVWVICENVPQIANVAFSVSDFEVVSRQRSQDTEKDYLKGIYSFQETLQLGVCCEDLKKQGYEVAVFEIPALAKNAPHQRMRTWIIAHADKQGLEGRQLSSAINRSDARVQFGAETGGFEPNNSTDSERLRRGRRSGRKNGNSQREFSESERKRRELRSEIAGRNFTNSYSQSIGRRTSESDGGKGRSTSSFITSIESDNPNCHSSRKFQPKRGIRKVGQWIRNGLESNTDINSKSSANGCQKPSRRKKSGSSEIATSNTACTRLERRRFKRGITKTLSQNRVELCFGNSSNFNRAGSFKERQEFARWKNNDRSNNHKWFEVATEFCGMDDGLSAGLDVARLRADISRWYPNATEENIERAIEKLVTRYRRERIESLGNSIIPVVAMEFFRVIKLIESEFES